MTQAKPPENRLRLSIAFLVLANLIPVFGVLFLDWDVLYLLLLFWCENVILGFFGILKMLVSGSGIFQPLFFTVHYGGFMFGHVMVLLAMFSGSVEDETGKLSDSDVFVDAVFNRATLIPIVALFVSHGWSFATNFLQTDERTRLTANQAMALPYKRMVITHIALIGGGIALTKMGQPLVGLLLLMAMKIALDIVFHRREHQTIDL